MYMQRRPFYFSSEIGIKANITKQQQRQERGEERQERAKNGKRKKKKET